MLEPNDDHIFRPTSHGSRARAALTCVVTMGALFGIMVQPTAAATEVRGHAGEMQLLAENASIAEVLKALSGTFKLTYKLPPNINRFVTGFYRGSLHQVLSRILDGNDYVVGVSDNGTEVIVLRASGATFPAPANHTIVSRENPVTTFVPANEPIPPPTPPLSSYLSVNTTP